MDMPMDNYLEEAFSPPGIGKQEFCVTAFAALQYMKSCSKYTVTATFDAPFTITPPVVNITVNNQTTWQVQSASGFLASGILAVVDWGERSWPEDIPDLAANKGEISHTYTQPGTYAIELVLKKPPGTASATATVHVFPKIDHFQCDLNTHFVPFGSQVKITVAVSATGTFDLLFEGVGLLNRSSLSVDCKNSSFIFAN